MAIVILGDPRIERVVTWWTPRRFEMAVALVRAQRMRRGQPSTRERIAFDMASNPTQLRRYLVGETRKPSARSVHFIDAFFVEELGRGWIELVEAALDDEGAQLVGDGADAQSPAHTAPAAGVF